MNVTNITTFKVVISLKSQSESRKSRISLSSLTGRLLIAIAAYYEQLPSSSSIRMTHFCGKGLLLVLQNLAWCMQSNSSTEALFLNTWISLDQIVSPIFCFNAVYSAIIWWARYNPRWRLLENSKLRCKRLFRMDLSNNSHLISDILLIHGQSVRKETSRLVYCVSKECLQSEGNIGLKRQNRRL